MNNKILQKCLDEVNKETPDLSYIKGMLETLLAFSGSVEPSNKGVVGNSGISPTVSIPVANNDPVIAIASAATSNLEEIKRMAGAQ